MIRLPLTTNALDVYDRLYKMVDKALDTTDDDDATLNMLLKMSGILDELGTHVGYCYARETSDRNALDIGQFLCPGKPGDDSFIRRMVASASAATTADIQTMQSKKNLDLHGVYADDKLLDAFWTRKA